MNEPAAAAASPEATTEKPAAPAAKPAQKKASAKPAARKVTRKKAPAAGAGKQPAAKKKPAASKKTAGSRKTAISKKKPAAKPKPATAPAKKVAKKAAKKPKKAAKIYETASKSGDEVMRLLNNEHRYISGLVDALELQVQQLAPGGKPDYRMLRDMVAYLSEYPDEFHHPLEDLVFKRLEKKDRSIIRDVEELLLEHQDMAKETRYLLQTLNAVCEGNQKPLRKSLYDYFRDYISMYRAHIDIEEGTVFPAARQQLNKADWDYVEQHAKEAEDPLFNDFVAKEYETLAAYLKNQREGARAEFALLEIFSIYAVIESTQAVFEGVAQAQEVCVKHGKKALDQQLNSIRESREQGGSAWLSLPGKLTNNALKQSKASAAALSDVAKDTWTGSTAPYTSRFASLLRLWT